MVLFEERVTLEPVEHRYWHKDGSEYASLSRVRSHIKPHFEKEYLSRKVAEREGKTAQQVQDEWAAKGKVATDHGTRIHEALERYEKTAVILPADEDLRPMIIALTSEYNEYYMVHQEKTLYDEEYKIAGTADHIIETTSHKKSVLNIDDYKTNISKGIYFENKYKKYLLGPFQHVMDTNYFDYSLQLSCYAHMLENLTGRKIGTLSIVFIPPHNPLAYRRIPVNYMKMEVIALFNYYKELKRIKVEEGDAVPVVASEEKDPTPNFG